MKSKNEINPTLNYLYSLHKFGMKFGLRNIRSLLRFVGNPHKKLKTIHIAGTNGKGSTSSMIAAILTAAGYKVGLYTSPHLIKFNERIRINGEMISDEEIVRYTKKIKPGIQKLKATFFEATTTIAFKYFADQKIDVAVIETGLGGRLDSTNVIKPIVSVITSIGKDHTEQLGKTFSKIAYEKAGIIKAGVPVVLGSINGTSKKVIRDIARERKSPIIRSTDIQTPSEIKIELKGKHQIVNAKCAIGAVNIIKNNFSIDETAIRIGLENTSRLTGLRARFEIIKGTPDVLLDVAHNPDGIRTLSLELHNLNYSKLVVVFSVMKDKDYLTMLKVLKEYVSGMIAVEPKIERALPLKDLYDVMKTLKIKSRMSKTITDAVSIGKKLAGKDGLVVITGSHYLVGEAIDTLKL